MRSMSICTGLSMHWLATINTIVITENSLFQKWHLNLKHCISQYGCPSIRSEEQNPSARRSERPISRDRETRRQTEKRKTQRSKPRDRYREANTEKETEKQTKRMTQNSLYGGLTSGAREGKKEVSGDHAVYCHVFASLLGLYLSRSFLARRLIFSRAGVDRASK